MTPWTVLRMAWPIWTVAWTALPAEKQDQWRVHTPPALISQRQFACEVRAPGELANSALDWEVRLLGAKTSAGRAELDRAARGRLETKAPKAVTRLDVQILLQPATGKPFAKTLSVYPDKLLVQASKALAPRSIGTLGVGPEVMATLKAAGLDPLVLKTDLAVKLFDRAVLMVGGAQLAQCSRRWLESLTQRMRRGMWVVVLAQEGEAVFDELRLMPHRYPAGKVEASWEHPFLQGIPARDLRRWVASRRTGHVLRIVAEPGESPRRAATRPRIDGPHFVVGFEQTESQVRRGLLATRQVGRGMIVWCQQPIEKGFQNDPIAQRILCNIFRAVSDERRVVPAGSSN